MAVGTGRRFVLLLWKNALLLKRQRFYVTFLQLGLPAMFAVILFNVRMVMDTTTYSEPRLWDAFSVDDPPGGDSADYQLAYSPDIPVVRRIMSDVIGKLQINDTDLGFATEAAMVDYLGDTVDSHGVWGGVHFSSVFTDNNSLPTQVKYKIRPRSEWLTYDAHNWYTSLMFPVWTIPGPREPENIYGGDPYYHEAMFLHLQRALDYSIITEVDTNVNLSGISAELERFPYPPYIDDPFIQFVLRPQLGVFILYGYMASVPFITRDIVLERERKLKEYMKIMSLGSGVQWAAWFIKSFFMVLISTILMTIFYSIDAGSGAAVHYSDPTCLFVFLIIYGISVITFCFAVSTLFKKATSAASAVVGLFFLMYCPWYVLDSVGIENLTLPIKIATSLSNNVAMSFGCIQIVMWEGIGTGLQWSNFFEQVNVDEPLTMAHVFAMLILDSLIYLAIAIYVDNIKPGDYGIPLPWYYCFTRSYWCGSGTHSSGEDGDAIPSMPELHPEFFEADPVNLQAGIQIRGLSKEFKKNKVKNMAVNEISMNMYEGQITAMLGHNGAGKTTTMSMLTGFLPPTSGTAFMAGYSISHQMTSIRESLGLCPQHDILFDTMTVSEHLHFFGELKGVPKADLQGEVDQMITLLDLEEKKNKLASGLSGGMKRKLSMGIALLGGSKIVVLDEPTSGMDPEARRQTWDILQRQREGRTILLSTHFMDEADQLGDRIAILANGVVQCCGSSLFLKQKYGVGYHLVMVKDENCDVSMVTNLVQSCVPDAVIENNISAELSYTLPQHGSAHFEQLFTRLEMNHVSLGITSFGASVTTMEEVFLKVGEDAGHGVANIDENAEEANGETNYAYEVATDEKKQALPPPPVHIYREEAEPVGNLEGAARYMQQFRAMFVKRVINTIRNKLVTFFQLALPIVFTVFAIVIAQNSGGGSNDPEALMLDLSKFAEAGFTQKIAYMTNGTLENATVSALANSFVATRNTTIPAAYDTMLTYDYLNSIPEYMADPDLETYLGDIGDVSMQQYSQNYMVAARIEGIDPAINYSVAGNHSVRIVGVFNNMAYHMVAITLGVLDNTMINYMLGDGYSVEATNHPLPFSETAGVQVAVTEAATTGFTISLQLTWGMMFLMPTFILFLVKERATKAKHVQYVSGVHVFTYWLSTFAWDFINFLVPGTIVTIMILAFQVDGFTDGSNIGLVFLLLIVFACSALPFIYLWSYLFTTPSNGYVAAYLYGFFVGMGFLLTVFILRIINDSSLVAAADLIEWIGYITCPYFGFGQGLMNVHLNYFNKMSCTSADVDLATVCSFADIIPNYTHPCCPDACGASCATYQDDYFAWANPGIGRSLIFLILQCFCFFGLIFLFESGLCQHCVKAVSNSMHRRMQEASEETLLAEMGAIAQEDEDVADERERITSMSVPELSKSCSLIIRELRKFYGGFLAVDHLSVGINQGECFGLLGVNGAGKTTTFKMLTGDIAMSSGDAFLCGHSIISDIKKAQKYLGYCPQFDALIEQMTVRETLVMFARLRGVPEHHVNEVVEKTIASVLIGDHKDKLASTLSGGNKRKLSTGIAIIGDPPVVFLDEPTTGMDPVARRALWDTLSGIRASGRTLVLTSHSMEECEALCTQIAIMVNGKFKCLGSPQYLKNKFSEGYMLQARVGASSEHTIDENMSRLRHFVEESFINSRLKDSHLGYLNYQVSSEAVSWAQVFGMMERAKTEYNIEDYSVSQTTLEQVFINLARGQREPREKGASCREKCFCCCLCCRPRHSITPSNENFSSARA